jgi:hypothetical protein
MVEAKKSDSVDRGGQDKIEDSSMGYTASFEERSGHRECIVANHMEPGSEMDLLGRSPKITECHDVSRVLGEATCAWNKRATTQGNDDRLMGEIDRFYTRKDFHTEVGVPVTHDTKEALLQVPRAVPMPDDSTLSMDGKLLAKMVQGNSMNPLGNRLAKVTLDAVESQGKCLREDGHDARKTEYLDDFCQGTGGRQDKPISRWQHRLLSRALGRISRDEPSPPGC